MVDSRSKIMFEELPNVDKLWQLLNDILVVRSMLILELENELYEKLILIHRDPNLLMWMTRDPREAKPNRRHVVLSRTESKRSVVEPSLVRRL